MGRSRAASRSTDDDNNQSKFKKKKTNPANESGGTTTSVSELGKEGKGALYHCNYCNKNMSGVIRIKCAVCPDFDLCVECFSVGAEVTPHISSHPYRVMDNLSFPFITTDWNADEELLLLEAVEMYGFGNWTEVGEHVATKTKLQCIDHYSAVYINSICFPLPDMSRVMGKSKEELIAMAKENEIKKESPASADLSPKKEPPFLLKLKYEARTREDPVRKSSSSPPGDVSVSKGLKGNAVRKTANVIPNKDSSKVEVVEQLSDRSIGAKKLRLIGDERQPSVAELSGYNFKRKEFEIEYENDAELLLADMEFKETDTKAEHDSKLQILHVYSKRLDERKRRKEFVVGRKLFFPDPLEINHLPEERDIYERFKVFARYQSKEEHEKLLEKIIQEHRIIKSIKAIQEARAAGYRTAAEANRYIEEKRKKEAEESIQRASTGVKALKSPKGLPPSLNKDIFHRNGGQAVSNFIDDWDISGFSGSELLSDTERRLCNEIRLLPSHYLKMLQTLSIEMKNGNINKKSDAYTLFKVNPSKVDRVYDMAVEKGIIITQS